MKHDRGEYGGLPAPDAKDPDHGNFVRDWFGQIADEELGTSPIDDWTGLSVGEVVRDQVLAAIDAIEMRHARRVAAIERAAIVAYQEHEKGIRGDGQFQPWELRTEGSKDVFRSVVEALDVAGMLKVDE